MKKYFIILTISLLLTACKGNANEADNTTTTQRMEVTDIGEQVTKEEQNNQQEPEEEQSEQTQSISDIMEGYIVRGETPQAIIDVLLNDAEFIDTEKDNKRTRMSEFTYGDNEQILKITDYAVVDIDDDGYNEIVAYLDAYIGLVEVFHYEDGQVYGYQLGYTSVLQISADGVFEQGTTASELYHYRLQFDKEKSMPVLLCGIEESEQYFIGDSKVAKEVYEEFEENIYREKAVLYKELSLLSRFAEKEKEFPYTIAKSYTPTGETPQQLIDVLLYDGEFVSTDEGNKTTKLSEFKYNDGNYDEEVAVIDEYAVIDLDNDGYNEIVAYIGNYMGQVEIFHYEDGIVYGYQFPYRGVIEINKDGVVRGSSGAEYSINYTLDFQKDTYVETVVCMTDGNLYYIEGKKTTQQLHDEYSKELWNDGRIKFYQSLALLEIIKD